MQSFFPLSTADFGARSHSAGGRPGHRGVLSSIPGLYPPAPSPIPISGDSQKCLPTWPGPPGGQGPPTENHRPGGSAVRKDQVRWGGDEVAPVARVPGKTSEEVTLGPKE